MTTWIPVSYSKEGKHPTSMMTMAGLIEVVMALKASE